MGDKEFVDLMLQKAAKKEEPSEPQKQIDDKEIETVEKMAEEIRRRIQERI